jgi:hypothetical protein
VTDVVRSRISRRAKRTVALFGGAALVVLAWPGPSGADVAETSLGGYSGVAQAEAIRIQIFEPVLPIPADPGKPQVDAGVAYAKSNVDTGPVTRATASYLWPGDTIGDGFGALVGNDKAEYSIQVNSRYPETATSPAKNTAQLTEGNGMTTSTDGFDTKATVTGLGIAGPGTDLLGGIGKGLHNLPGLGNPTAPPTKDLPELPLPVGKLLAALATVQNVQSTTSIVVGKNSVTSTAQTKMSQIALLGGLINIDSMRSTATTVSDGKTATTSGSVRPGAITLGGLDLGLVGKGVQLGDSSTKLPDLPSAVTDLLGKIGIEINYAPSSRTSDGATGSLASDALVISIDTQPLKTALNLGGLIGPLQQLVSKIPYLGSTLGPLLGLGPKIVIRIGDVFSTATAAPAYVGPVVNPSGGNPTPGGGHTGGGGNTGGVPPINTGGSPPINTGGGVPLPSQAPGTTTPTPTQPSAFTLPGLGNVPKALIIGGLALAVLCGWLFRVLGGFVLGGARNCAYGLSTGVPDLRKG